MSENVSFKIATDLIVQHGVSDVVEHPAAYEFMLDDPESGFVVTLFPGGEDYGDVWTLSRRQ